MLGLRELLGVVPLTRDRPISKQGYVSDNTGLGTQAYLLKVLNVFLCHDF